MTDAPMPEIEAVLSEIAAEMASRTDRGDVATYIPQLGRIDPRKFGLAVAMADGRVFCVGDADEAFSIQSISKVLTLTLALGKIGDALWRRVGREPSGNPFNSIVQLEQERGIPRNPFINPGAIVVSDVLLAGHQPREAIGEILRFVQFLTDDETVVIDSEVAASERATGFRNFALANYMRSFGNLDHAPELALGVYFHHCHRHDVPPTGSGRPVSRLRRAQSVDGPLRRLGRAGAAHQRADADMRPLRRFRRFRLPGRLSRQERRRRRHFGRCAGRRVDGGVVTRPQPQRQFQAWVHGAGKTRKGDELVSVLALTRVTQRKARIAVSGAGFL
jgi:hypothetical protein